MAESMCNNNEPRANIASNGYSGNNNALSRKKTNNITGGDLNASPKHNKLNGRGFNKDNQNQKQNRSNTNNNHQREQRNNPGNETSNSKQRNRARNHPLTYNDNVQTQTADVYDDFIDDFYEICVPAADAPIERKIISGNGKKQNANHLLNFQYLDKRQGRPQNSGYYGFSRWSTSTNGANRQSFSKEQFLQANCQFVVEKGSIDFSPHFADPDLAIDWTHVEQVHIHSMQPLKCPICLSEPRAGKITRCGHVYCWSCLLHYLALSDKSWRKCPVCCESIYKRDIRSVQGIISRTIKPGDWIHFRLMRRERGSAVFYPKNSVDRTLSTSKSDESIVEINKKNYAHLLFVDQETILNDIIEKENLELLKQLEEDGDQPESCFVRQALEENDERRKTVEIRMNQRKLIDRIVSVGNNTEEHVDLLPKKCIIVYEDAFEDKFEVLDCNQPNTDNEKKITERETSRSESDQQIPTKTPSNETQNYVYFYQADEIYHAYLNGLNTRILIHEFGSYQQCPDELRARVEAIETYFMTEELRSQFRFLSHLPLTCEFQLVEIRLHQPLISTPTMDHFSDEIYRRRQLRLKKERMETRRQQRAELVETQKLFSQYPPEMMYIPQESFPVNSTNSMEEFPAMISSNTISSPPQSASVQISDENLSPPAGISFAQMLKQQAPPSSKSLNVSNTMIVGKNLSVATATKSSNINGKKGNYDSDDDCVDVDNEYYASTRHFQSSFSLEEVFERLKTANGEENSTATSDQAKSVGPTKKKNKKNKQVLFATGLGGQAKL